MKKKIFQRVFWVIFAILIIIAIYNTHKCLITGNQTIKISTGSTAYANEDLYVSVVALDEEGTELATETKVTLLDGKNKKVKNVNVTYEENTAKISIPEIEAGTYYINAKVQSEEGTDTVQKKIYVNQSNAENTTISLDKGIYKPGDTINFRALLTAKDNDEPVSKDVNISIYDGNKNKVYTQDTTTSSYGIVNGSFDLADELNSGTYSIVVTTPSSETIKQFKVNPYVTPKYELTLNYDKTTYLVGDTAKITVNSEYFFGEPVTGAELKVFANGEEYGTYSSDESGNVIIEYEFKESGTYSIYVEAVDSSNYYVEKSDSISVGTDIFEIELLPEYGTLVAGQKNDVYVFTKKADGTPIKTYVTVTSDKFTKQIATDENGIGKFQIDVESISTTTSSKYNKNYSKNQKFSITAQNTDGEEVKTNQSLSIETKALLVSTDKVKYEQGEDITVNISTVEDITKNIYFLKNNKVIKMVSTDSDEITANLEDTYGLIDIYVTEDLKTSSSSSTSYKRTVFINPEKELNISINTDKEEYEPGENITISFTTQDENSKNVDAALLVSMIDNQVLSLAENDLSIDNIKLALSEISFSEELDASTIYSCIVNEKSEQTLMGLLLKQGDTDINVSETKISNEDESKKANIIAIVTWIIIGLALIVILLIKIKPLREFAKHIPNIIILELLIIGTTYFIYYEFFWKTLDFTWWFAIIELIIGLSIYIAGVSKIYKKIYRTSISIFITCILLMLSMALLTIIVETGSNIGIAILIVLAIIILIMAIVSRNPKIQKSKFAQKVSKEAIYILKLIVAIILAVIVGKIIEKIIPIDDIGTSFGIIALYVFNYLLNISKEDSTQNTDEVLGESRKSLIIIVTLVVAFIGISLFIMVFNNAKSTISDTSRDDMISPGDLGITATYGSESSSSNINDLTDKISDIFSSSKSNITSDVEESDVEEDSIDPVAATEENSEDTGTEETIRSVFLESMCFIPELVSENGVASVDLTLSDNITTWTIQTVGNTKDGKVGYGIIDNVKVMKDFFVDFDLPKNLVEGDTVSIPVTVYNYTENSITTNLTVQTADWFTLNGESKISIEVPANATSMKYISITMTATGSNKFRVEANSDLALDIVEKTVEVNPKGYKVEQVVSTGELTEDISEDILILEDTVENTTKATVKIYSSAISQTVEGMENIFKMPTGCFEQISSSLYPNILALKYLEDTETVNIEIKEKALNYISTGYQKLLTYEVKDEKGGYSLYGKSPASTALTAYGLMELTDLSEVYSIDENVLNNMKTFLYGKQNSNGSFELTGKTSFEGDGSRKNTLALNAYIIWALSESDPENSKLEKSVSYLKDNLDDIEDNYTLALIANVLANVNDNEAKNVMRKLTNNIITDGNSAYITSNVTDCYGTNSKYQTIQTVALTSMALSKTGYNTSVNNLLVNYLINQKDTKGTWHTTHATILALKAINELNENAKMQEQTIKVTINSETKEIKIGDDPLSIYTVEFNELSKENKLEIEAGSGNIYYEVIEEYYVPWSSVLTENDEIGVLVTANTELTVNDILTSNIQVTNNSSNDIVNGMVTISIPQGFTVDEDSLLLLETKGLIQKYETSYTDINLYLQDFEVSEILTLNVNFRALYPVNIEGLSVRVYDYYNPEIKGKSKPIEIKVNE